jgi:hypothetical protein
MAILLYTEDPDRDKSRFEYADLRMSRDIGHICNQFLVAIERNMQLHRLPYAESAGVSIQLGAPVTEAIAGRLIPEVVPVQFPPYLCVVLLRTFSGD